LTALPDAEQLCETLARRLRPLVTPKTAMIGLYTGGAWLAERLHPLLALPAPLGLMDIAFYRDDYHTQGLHHDPKRTRIPFDVNGRDLLLVDDVLYTGRTVRAAMNELFDYGRPQSITLVVLADRGGRQLPICAQYCGAQVEVPHGMRLRLKRDANAKLALALEPQAGRKDGAA
jgi:pyrimidine operon attenuation protein / uracil phosphoribosyltransferase